MNTCSVKVEITRWVDDTQPGVVEFRFVDVLGNKHVFEDKVPIVTAECLSPDDTYPRAGELDCVMISSSFGPRGIETVTIDTSQPWSVSSTTGETQFVVNAHELIVSPEARSASLTPTMHSVVYVDVDDTLIRSVGTKTIPVPHVINHVRELYDAGIVLYLWSRGGEAYARAVATQLGIVGCFSGFLPKPTAILDDEALESWKFVQSVHPNSCRMMKPENYRRK